MAFLNWNSVTTTSARLYIDGLNNTTTYSEVYMSCNGSSSPNMAKIGIRTTVSYEWLVTGLQCGTRYNVNWSIRSAGGSTASDTQSFTTSSCPAPVYPGTPSYVSASADTSRSGYINVDWGSASDATYYKVSISNGYTSGTIYGYSASIGGLAEGTTYTVTVTAYNSVGTGGSRSTTVTTKTFAPPDAGTPSGIGASNSTQTPGTSTVSFTKATNGAYHVITVRKVSGNVYHNDSGYITGTSYVFSGMETGTQYSAIVTAYNSIYKQGGQATGTFTTANWNVTNLVATPSPTVGGQVTVSWSAVTGATSYSVTVRTASDVYVTVGTTAGTSLTFTGMAQYVTLKFIVVASTSTGSGGQVTTTAFMPDLAGPVIANVVGDGNGKAYLSFTATDALSGMRATNRFYTEIGDSSGANYGQGEFSNNTFRTFTVSNTGGALIQNATYTLRVTAYDVSNNFTRATTTIQYKRARPLNWTPHTTKIGGQNVNITAAEWNSFGTRINEFRIWKGHGNYTFTLPAVQGTPITAAQANQGRTAIATMTTAVPVAATSGTNLTAAFFNQLVTALNDLT